MNVDTSVARSAVATLSEYMKTATVLCMVLDLNLQELGIDVGADLIKAPAELAAALQNVLQQLDKLDGFDGR